MPPQPVVTKIANPSPSGPVKKRSVARKSTSGSSQSNQSTPPVQEKEVMPIKWEAPWLKLNKRYVAVNTNAAAKQSRGKEGNN
jgi:hypothetical protein